jgi:CRP/FNR family cyclic AMP-dependent transcriptional regulator
VNADDLRLIPLFANLAPEVRENAAGRLKEISVVIGTALARQGDFAYHYFVVREGLAAVTIDDVHVDTLGPGASFGEIGVIEHGKRTANVVAITPMRLLTMTVWDFNDLAEASPEFAAHAKTMAQERLSRG